MIEVSQNTPTSSDDMTNQPTPQASQAKASQSKADQSSLYQKLDTQLMQSSFAASAAEAHGLVAGLACRDFNRAELETKTSLFGFIDQSEALFWSLLEMVGRDLRKDDFNFKIWLPEYGSLEARTAALGQWCHGFTLGLNHDNNSAIDRLNPELRESFDDLIAISGAMSEAQDNAEDNEGEVAYIEVSEYVRISAQLIFEELNPNAHSEATAGEA